MSPSKPNPPRYTASQLHSAADDFRAKYWDGKLPIEIMSIIEFDLGMDVRPALGMRRYGVDALLMSDLQTIYVDQERYMDTTYDNRLNFSLAHELGHKVLHSDFYKSLHIEKLEDLYVFNSNFSESGYQWLERWHCDEFAGRLLVPPDNLLFEAEKVINQYRPYLEEHGIEMSTAVNLVSPRLAPLFSVSTDVIDRRLTKESIIEKLQGS
jgi:hypothetical protein